MYPTPMASLMRYETDVSVTAVLFNVACDRSNQSLTLKTGGTTSTVLSYTTTVNRRFYDINIIPGTCQGTMILIIIILL